MLGVFVGKSRLGTIAVGPGLSNGAGRYWRTTESAFETPRQQEVAVDRGLDHRKLNLPTACALSVVRRHVAQDP